MDYGRLEPSEPGGSSSMERSHQSELATSRGNTRSKKKLLVVLSVISIVLIAASAASAVFLIGVRSRASGKSLNPSLAHRPTQAISRTCSKTRFPSLCLNSLVEFPGALSATEEDLVHISFNMTLQRLNKALYASSGISNLATDPLSRSAYDDCLELLDDSIDALSRSLTSVVTGGGGGAAAHDVVTWLSAALTNQDTCGEGFDGVAGGAVKSHMAESLRDLSELVSNCLAIFSGSVSDDFSGIPIQNRRRLLEEEEEEEEMEGGDISGDFPIWLGRRERRLLALPVSAIQADIVVSNAGNGSNGEYKTILEAIKKVPEHSSRRTIIYVRAGR